MSLKDIIVMLISLLLLASILALAKTPTDWERLTIATNLVIDDSGSGVLIDSASGLVLTAKHVVAGLDAWSEVPVRYRGQSGVAVLRALHDNADVALLVLEDALRPAYGYTVKFPPETYQAERQATVIIIGNGNMEIDALTQGVLSHPHREIDGHPQLQFSGGLINGNSGGGLYSAEGYLLGIVSMVGMYSHGVMTLMGMGGPVPLVHIGYAVPWHVIVPWLQHLGYRPQLAADHRLVVVSAP